MARRDTGVGVRLLASVCGTLQRNGLLAVTQDGAGGQRDEGDDGETEPQRIFFFTSV